VNPVVVDTQNADINVSQWHHVAAVHDVSSRTRQIFVDGTAVVLNTGGTSSTYTGTWGSDSGTASIGGETDGAGSEAVPNWRFNGAMDEVRVYNIALSTAEVNTVMNETRVCPSSGPDHYSISHSGTGITCAAETVTVTAHNADHSTYAVTSDTSITVTTTPVVDAITSSPVIIPSGNSSATFSITETTVTASIDINVTDGTSTETSGSADTNPLSADYDDQKLAFVDSLFQFVTDTNVPPATTIGTHIGGKPSSTAPNSHNLYLRAVRTDDTSGTAVCVSALDAGTHDIDMGYQCIDTNNCSANELSLTNNLTYNSGAATTIAHNDGATTANTLPVTLDFDAMGYTPLSFLYNNVGQVALFAGDYLASGGTINGDASNSFIARPFGLTLDFGDSGDGDGDAYDMREDDWNNGGLDGSNNNSSYAANVSGTAFNRAGVNFLTEITAVLWQGADDTDNNGVPDTNSNLYNNSVATLYGQESTAVLLSTDASTGLQISHTLDAPAVGVSGTFSGVATAGGVLTSFTSGKGLATLNWNEVGIIDIQMVVMDYLGDSSFSSTYVTENVGRFYPDHFSLAVNPVTNRIALGGGGVFTYMDEDFQLSYTLTAENTGNGTTQNYSTTSGFALLNTAGELNYAAVDTSLPTNLTGRLTTTTPMLNWVAGNLVISDRANISRSTVPDGPYLLMDVGITPTDDDGVLLTSYDLDVNADSTDDHALVSTTQVRFGRMALSNTFGSELTLLNMPMVAEYYNVSNFIVNTDDNLTPLSTTELILSSSIEGGQTDGDIQVLAGQVSQASMANNPLLSGIAGLSFCAPGSPACTPTPGNEGYIDVQLDLTLFPYLRFDWDGDGNHDNDPVGRATFGIYNGDSKQIYYRQIYQ